MPESEKQRELGIAREVIVQQIELALEEIEKAIDTLSYNLHVISIDKVLEKMGFPKNYKEIKNIERSYIADEQ